MKAYFKKPPHPQEEHGGVSRIAKLGNPNLCYGVFMKLPPRIKSVLFMLPLVLVTAALSAYLLAHPVAAPNLVSDTNPIGIDTSPYNGSYRVTQTSDASTITIEVDSAGHYRIESSREDMATTSLRWRR